MDIGNVLEDALCRVEELERFKKEVVKPVGSEILDVLHKHGLTVEQSKSVIGYVGEEIFKISNNVKL